MQTIRPWHTPGMQRHAVLSEDGRYRYRLDRRWGDGPTCTFVMLNPSTADARVDDPTIRRCMGFAQDWGFRSLAVVNLFAFRTPSPRDLAGAKDPIGPKNNAHLAAAARKSQLVVAGWGNQTAMPGRIEEVVALVEETVELHSLGTTKEGNPRHPLYVRKGMEPQAFRLWEESERVLNRAGHRRG